MCLAIVDQGVTETLQRVLEIHSNSLIIDVTESMQIIKFCYHSRLDDVRKTILISSSQQI